jgi:uncharacterized OB-fold protein
MTPANMEFYPTGPSVHGRDTAHWEGLRAGEILVQRCASCQTWLWPAREICASCHSFDLGWAPIPPRGKVFTHCRTHFPYISELADKIPYTSVVVEIEGVGGVRLLGRLADDSGGVAIGDVVEADIQTPSDTGWAVIFWRRTEGVA